MWEENLPTIGARMRIAWLALVLGACGGGGSGMDPDAAVDGTVMTVDAAPTRYVAYVSGGTNIDWYDVDKSTGALTHVSSVAAFRTGANFLATYGLR
jgi:hypothetical protein